jgi:undecaprenyl-diphosphatase
MNVVEVIFLGLVQGLTEFIPVSSSGHLIVAREFFNFSDQGLAFDAVLQLATALAVLVYFVKDFPRLIRDKQMVWALVLGTIPAVVFGLLLQGQMETAFRSAHLVAWMLLLGAGIMYGAEKWGKQNRELTPMSGLGVGFFQVLALVPGFSRSGATISGGLFLGLTREAATRFSFLLSLPIIVGSGLKELLALSSSGALSEFSATLLLASFVAFGSGILAIHFLINYLKTHSLTPFIWYRVALAGLIFILL